DSAAKFEPLNPAYNYLAGFEHFKIAEAGTSNVARATILNRQEYVRAIDYFKNATRLAIMNGGYHRALAIARNAFAVALFLESYGIKPESSTVLEELPPEIRDLQLAALESSQIAYCVALRSDAVDVSQVELVDSKKLYSG